MYACLPKENCFFEIIILKSKNGYMRFLQKKKMQLVNEQTDKNRQKSFGK